MSRFILHASIRDLLQVLTDMLQNDAPIYLVLHGSPGSPCNVRNRVRRKHRQKANAYNKQAHLPGSSANLNVAY